MIRKEIQLSYGSRNEHGQSEKPETGYDTATLVEDIRQFLDALNIQREDEVLREMRGFLAR